MAAKKNIVPELFAQFTQDNLRVEAEGVDSVPFSDREYYAGQVFWFLEGRPARSDDEITDYHRNLADRVADYQTLSDKDRENLELFKIREAYQKAVASLNYLANVLEVADAQSPSSPGPLLDEHLLALAALDQLEQGILGGFFEPADDRAA